MKVSRRTLVMVVLGALVLVYVSLIELRFYRPPDIGSQTIQRVGLTEQTLNEHAREIVRIQSRIRTINEVNDKQWDQLTDRHLDQIEHRKRIEALEQK